MPIVGLNTALNITKKATGARLDPYGAFNFLVEIEGIIAGGFTEVSGLTIQTEVETVREGGVNDFEYKLPKGTTYTDLTLKHGLTDLDLLWNWYEDVVNGKIKRRNGTIYLLDSSGLPAMWWDFFEAYPIKWIGPTFNASSNSVASEALVLTHHGLTKPNVSQIVSAIKGTVSL